MRYRTSGMREKIRYWKNAYTAGVFLAAEGETIALVSESVPVMYIGLIMLLVGVTLILMAEARLSKLRLVRRKQCKVKERKTAIQIIYVNALNDLNRTYGQG